MTGKQEGPYKGEETKAEEDKVWHLEHKQENINLYSGRITARFHPSPVMLH